jgi:outer membrane biosynthesis protein TonB
MCRRLAGLLVAATAGLLLTGPEPTVAGPEALGQRIVDDDAKWPVQTGVCEREGATFVRSKPRMLREWQRPPRKVRDVRPAYPELPPGTRGSGVWIGEVLLDESGKVSHIWTIRQARLSRPFPAFNSAILDAVRQWQFEPFVVESEARPVCMTVSVTINWRQSPKAVPSPSRPPRLTGRHVSPQAPRASRTEGDGRH